MSKIKFDLESIRTFSTVQKITRADIKDVTDYTDRQLIIVTEGQLAKAVGKNGQNVKQLERTFNRKIKIVEFNPNVIQFIKNLVFPLKIKEIIEDEGVLTIIPPDLKTRGYLIGRNAQTLRETESIVRRYFPISEIKVDKISDNYG